MLLRIAFSLFLMLITISGAAQTITYHISLNYTTKERTLQVTLECQGDADGTTHLFYANNQFGEPDQFSFLDIKPQAGITVLPDSNRIEIKHAPNALIKFEYSVKDLQSEKMPFYEYCCYKPILQAGYFHLQSGHLLIYPEDFWPDKNARRNVRIHWVNTPNDWLIHSSFGAGTEQGGHLTQTELSVGVFVGGDFRRHTFEVHDKPVHFITRGNWVNVKEDSLTSMMKQVVEGHRTLWNDFADTIYTVTFLPIDDAPWTAESKMTSVGGSGLTNSFFAYATNHAGLDMGLLKYLFTHELMHRWVGTEIQNAEEEKQYWFSEGFTDYYTYKSQLKYGLITLEDWLKAMNNEVIRPHFLSTIKSRPNDELSYDKFWNGGKEWEKLPYRRGCLYAFYLDTQIKKRSNGRYSLDNPMRDLLQMVRTNPTLLLDKTLFIKAIEPYCGPNAGSDYIKYIENGTPISWNKRNLPNGLKVINSSGTVSSGKGPNYVTSVRAYRNLPVLVLKEKADKGSVGTELTF